MVSVTSFRCKKIAENGKLLFVDSESESEHKERKWSKNKIKFKKSHLFIQPMHFVLSKILQQKNLLSRSTCSFISINSGMQCTYPIA